MEYVYASRTGNVESIVERLKINALKIESGNEKISEKYILLTYSDGYGDVPGEVKLFLEQNHDLLEGVIVSGDESYGEAFCQAGEIIASKYHVPCLYKVNNEGDEEDLQNIKALI